MAKSKVYTKTGDTGFTSLVGGKRVSKTNTRIEAYGTIDELNSFVACLLDEIENREDREFLSRIQYNLFTIGGYLATEDNRNTCQLSQEEIEILEKEIDTIDELIPPLKCFILPGGSKGNSLAHVCRTICRRSERCIYKIIEQEEVIASEVLKYMNRLSDYFFLLARKQSFVDSMDEIVWNKPCK